MSPKIVSKKSKGKQKVGRPRKETRIPDGQTHLSQWSFSAGYATNDRDSASITATHSQQEDQAEPKVPATTPLPISNESGEQSDMHTVQDRINIDSQVGVSETGQASEPLPDLIFEEEDCEEGESEGEDDGIDIPTKSVLREYFEKIQTRLTGDNGKEPDEYLRGTFWIDKKLPAFALKHKLDPTLLYCSRVFLWLPHHLVTTQLKCPKCDKKLGIKGYNKNPHCRRVVDLDSCFYIMSMRYECTGANCSKTVNAHDEDILKQLPQYLQAEFPAYLTYRCGVSRAVGNLLRTCMQNSTGPNRFSRLLREFHMLKHDRLELQYLTAMEYRHQTNVTPFSDFNDSHRYAGYVPTSKYLRTVYTASIDQLRPMMDKQMMLLDGEVLKGDHSFKLPKHIAKIDGAPTFNALYTVCNEYEEIRMQVLVPSKASSHLRTPFLELREAYRLYGHALPRIFFTDNVGGDKRFLESVFPSLKVDDSNLLCSDLPIFDIPSNVTVTCLRVDELINEALQRILSNTSNNEFITVGFQCVWGVIPPNDMMMCVQVAYDDMVYLVQVPQNGQLPVSLVTLLKSRSVTKIGRHLGRVFAKIEQQYGIPCVGSLEIATYCYDRQAIDHQSSNLSDICLSVLNQHLPQSRDDLNSLPVTSQEQKLAALDPYCMLQVYKKLQNCEVACRSFAHVPVSDDLPLEDYGEFPFVVKVDLRNLKTCRQHDHPIPSNSGEPFRNSTIMTANDGTESGAANNEEEWYDEDIEEVVGHIDGAAQNLERGPEWLTQIAARNPPITSSAPRRVLKDIYHLMALIKIPRKHGMANEFSSRFRDCLFEFDATDKAAVERHLVSKGTTWEKKLQSKPSWILRRVRRVVPSPEVIHPAVLKMFLELGPVKCDKYGKRLFDDEAWDQARLVLNAIARGDVSDPLISFYFIIGQDEHGLPLYRCSRGTNSLEGGVHQNIIRKFGSFGACPHLADCALADYRLRHNIDVGSINRKGRVHVGHYEPWLTEAIQSLRRSLVRVEDGSASIPFLFSSWFKTSNEKFGVAHFSTTYLESLNIELPELPLSGAQHWPGAFASTLQKRNAQYIFLAAKQGAKHAILPVHTAVEKSWFEDGQNRDFVRSKHWKQFAVMWNGFANGTTIFYKTPELLRMYFTLWSEIENRRRTLFSNSQHVNAVRNEERNKRQRFAAPANFPSLLAIEPNDLSCVSQPHTEQLTPATVPTMNRPLLPASFHTPVPLPRFSLEGRLLVPIQRRPLAVPKKTRRKRTCQVCKSNTCRGSGKRELCANLIQVDQVSLNTVQ